jgi:hypothetical protein
LLFLFLRLSGKRLSLRANQLPMWLPHTNSGSIGRCAPPAGLWRAGSQMKPDPSSALVVTGIYRLTRFLWILLGWGPLYESFPNRTGGKGAHLPIRPDIPGPMRLKCEDGYDVVYEGHILTGITLAIGCFGRHFAMKK